MEELKIILKNQGFKKFGLSWNLKKYPLHFSLKFQKTSFDINKYYINAGIYIFTSEKETLPLNYSDVWWRILKPEKPTDQFDIVVNQSEILECVKEQFIKTVKDISTLEELKKLVLNSGNRYILTGAKKKLRISS